MHKQIIKNDKGKQPQIRLGDLKTLPIKIADINIYQNMERLVNDILIQKNNDPTVNTTTLESQIDQLVYELYGLTEEEIGIVENSLK